MSDQVWGWALSLIGVYGFWLAGRKVWWAWYGRDEVRWLSDIAADDTNPARVIGAEDAYRDAMRLARTGPDKETDR